MERSIIICCRCNQGKRTGKSIAERTSFAVEFVGLADDSRSMPADIAVAKCNPGELRAARVAAAPSGEGANVSIGADL